jgi:hypothetical protein
MNDDIYKVQITYEVSIKKWRIDDQRIAANREWYLKVYDRNLGKWIKVSELNRPGEEAYITEVKVLD